MSAGIGGEPNELATRGEMTSRVGRIYSEEKEPAAAGEPQAAAGGASLHDLSTLNDTNQYHHDRDHQENMDESAQSGRGNQPK